MTERSELIERAAERKPGDFGLPLQDAELIADMRAFIEAHTTEPSDIEAMAVKAGRESQAKTGNEWFAREVRAGKFDNEPRLQDAIAGARQALTLQAAEVKRMREASEPFVEYGKILIGQFGRDDRVLIELWDCKITVGDFRALARAALKEADNG